MRKLVFIAMLLFLSVPAHAQTKTPVKFALDWLFNGNTAYALEALEKGYYAEEGLDMTVDRGFGAAGVPGLVATGAYDFGLSDVSSMIEYNARNPDKPLIAVMMVYDKAAYSVITLADRKINTFGDLVGRKIGSFTNDTAARFLPILAKANGFDLGKLTVLQLNIQIRDSLLMAGEVDAVTGFPSTAVINLIALGVPKDEVRVFKFNEYGLDIYGSAIIVTADFAKKNPKAVAGMVKALIRGIQDTIRNPKSAIAALKKRDRLTNEAVELQRQQMVLNDLIITPFTKANGLGAVDDARLAQQIDYVYEAWKLPRKPAASEIFTTQFLPPAAERQIP